MSYASKLDFLGHKYKGLFFELEPSIVHFHCNWELMLHSLQSP